MTRFRRDFPFLFLIVPWLVACSTVPVTTAPATPAATSGVVAVSLTPTVTVAATATPKPPTPTPRPPTATPTVSEADTLPAVCPPGSGENIIISSAAEGKTIVEMFEPQILAYLDARGDAQGLEAALDRLTLDDGEAVWETMRLVHSADVTGDATPEVVVGLLFYVEGQFADGALFVFRCQAGEYVGGAVTRIGEQLFAGQGAEPVVRAIQDVNGNGMPDIVISYVTVIGTHTNFTRKFRILEWDGSRFTDLVQGNGSDPHAAEVLNGDGVIRDTDGDGTLELELVHGAGRGPDAGTPASPRTDVWAWNGEGFTWQRRRVHCVAVSTSAGCWPA